MGHAEFSLSFVAPPSTPRNCTGRLVIVNECGRPVLLSKSSYLTPPPKLYVPALHSRQLCESSSKKLPGAHANAATSQFTLYVTQSYSNYVQVWALASHLNTSYEHHVVCTLAIFVHLYRILCMLQWSRRPCSRHNKQQTKIFIFNVDFMVELTRTCTNMK